MEEYVKNFFSELEVFEDKKRGHCYKIFIEQAILEFLENETKDTAFAVYRTFFDSYRIVLQGASNPFIDLLDILKNYEENAAILIDRQRDHYIHSVNVFILGLCIYSQNVNYRAAFDKKVMNKSEYPYSYYTKNEEFFYRWGLASLFHDIGYPVEIVGHQINKFVDFVTNVDKNDEKVNVQFSFANFDSLNRIAEIIPRQIFTKCYSEQFRDCAFIDLLKPVDLLAHKIHVSLGAELKAIKFALDDFVNVMARFSFIDHGYYSAIIVLKWYGFLIQSARYKPEYFFWPVLDSASAILLHNCYKNMMQNSPFNLGPLIPDTHPIAYLLMLCDELQEWNREAYGILDRLRTLPAKAQLEISDQGLLMVLETYNEIMPTEFFRKKRKLLYKLLDIKTVFNTVKFRCRMLKKPMLPNPNKELTPRPTLNELEKLARIIHELYNKKQLERYPDRPLKYPDFDMLPDSLKYSNLRQAMGIDEKLRLMNYKMCSAHEGGEPITVIPEEYVEILAKKEHESWVSERLSTGWTLSDEAAADEQKKTSPYLVSYDKLPEEIRELDRDAIKNIPILLEKIGMIIIKKEK